MLRGVFNCLRAGIALSVHRFTTRMPHYSIYRQQKDYFHQLHQLHQLHFYRLCWSNSVCSHSDKDSGIEGFPLRSWSIEIYLLNDRGEQVAANVFDEVTYTLHPSFGDRAVQSMYIGRVERKTRETQSWRGKKHSTTHLFESKKRDGENSTCKSSSALPIRIIISPMTWISQRRNMNRSMWWYVCSCSFMVIMLLCFALTTILDVQKPETRAAVCSQTVRTGPWWGEWGEVETGRGWWGEYEEEEEDGEECKQPTPFDWFSILVFFCVSFLLTTCFYFIRSIWTNWQTDFRNLARTTYSRSCRWYMIIKRRIHIPRMMLSVCLSFLPRVFFLGLTWGEC